MTEDFVNPNKIELFFGLVGPTGTNLNKIIDILKLCLKEVNFDVNTITISELLENIGIYKQILKNKPEDERIISHMDAGNKFRQKINRGDALAILSIYRLIKLRKKCDPGSYTAYIFKSLKNPEEVNTLRNIYRSSFFLISVYSERNLRIDYLSKKIADSRSRNYPDLFYSKAVEIIQRDEAEQDIGNLGQNVRDTFPKGDFFISINESKDDENIRIDMRRYIELIFGNTFQTPSNEEYGMFNAHASSKRSGSLARQVGAVITNKNGEIISTGMNEVPKIGGGLFTSEHKPDQRNFILGYDPSDKKKYNIITDLVQKLRDLEYLKINQEMTTDDFVKLLIPDLKGTYIMNIIEFTREVHAEMDALISASRSTISTFNCVLYTTTFPCHDCTKHIIAAGIKRVVYIEPYPKSLAFDLYSSFISLEGSQNCDTKVIYQPFAGVAPRSYMTLFEKLERKNSDGSVKLWLPSESSPRTEFLEDSKQYMFREAKFAKVLEEFTDMDPEKA